MQDKKRNKKELKRKVKQQSKKEIVLDYFPRGNIFCNQESTQIQKKNVENDFIFNESLYAFSSKPEGGKNNKSIKSEAISSDILKPKGLLTYDKVDDQEEKDQEFGMPQKEVSDKNVKKPHSARKDISKIPRIIFEKGNFCMMAACQINKYYMITNYTRNQKAYINQANATGELVEDYHIGDFIFGTIMEGSDKMIKNQIQQIVDISHKYQFTMNPSTYNFGISAQNLVPGVAVMGVISDVEQSGCYVELGLKDSSRGFIKNSNLGKQMINALKIGKPLNLVVSKISKKSKIINCLPIASQKGRCLEIESDKISFDALRPGSKVKCKVMEKYQNGVTIKFLDHFHGSIFIDHLQKSPKSYKREQIIEARIIAIKQKSKLIALSNLQHILQFDPVKTFEHGTKLEEAKVQKIVSESLILKSKDKLAILHRTNIPPQLVQKIKPGYKFPQVFLKQFNYFDNIAIAKPSYNEKSAKQRISFQSLKVGQLLNVQIIGISTKSKNRSGLSVSINNYLKAFIPLHHIADIPLHQVPSRYKKGKTIKAAVFMKNTFDKYVQLTMKPKLLSLLSNDFNLFSKQNFTIGIKCCGVVVNAKDKIGLFLQFYGDVFGIIYEEEVQSMGRQLDSFKMGEVLDVYVKSNSTEKRMIILSFKPGKVGQLIKNEKIQMQKLIDHISTLNSKGVVGLGKIKTINGRILLRSSLTVQNDKLFQALYQKASNQNQFLVRFDSPKQKNLIAILNSPGLILKQSILACLKSTLSEQQQQEREEESATLEFAIQKLDNNVPFVSSQSTTSRSKDYYIGEYVLGIVQQVKQQMGCIFKLVGKNNLKGFARKSNLKNFQLNRYKVGSIFKLQITGSKQEKIFVSNKKCYLLKDDQLQEISQIFENQRRLVNSFMHQDVDFFELYKVKLIEKKDNNQIIVKTKKGEILAVKLVNQCQEAEAKRFWIRFIDFQDNMLIGQYINSKKYACILEENKEGDNYSILFERSDYYIVENKKSLALRTLLKQNFLADNIELTDAVLQNGIKKEMIINLKSKNASILFSKKEIPSLSQQYEFKISNVLPTMIQGVEVQSKKQVKVSKAQFPKQLVQKIWVQNQKIQNTLPGVQLFPKFNKRDFIELTLLQEGHPNTKSLDSQISKNKQFRAVVQNVNLKSSSPIIISTSLKQRGSVTFYSIPLSYFPSTFDSIVDFKKVFEVGTLLDNVYFSSDKKKTRNDSQSLYSHHYFEISHDLATKPIDIGSKLLGRCFKIIQGKGVIVQLNQTDYGFLDICEMIDDFIYNPIEHFFGKNTTFASQGCCYCILRVIGKDQTHSQKWTLSMRKSHIEDKSYKQLSSASSNLQTIEEFLQKGCDYRNIIFKYKNIKAAKLVKENGLVLGYVSQCSEKGCFVKIAQGVVVRAALHQLEDKPENYVIGSLVLARITSKTSSGLINITMKKCNLLYGRSIKLKELQVGSLVSCIVTATAHRKIFVEIKGSSFRGKVKLRKQQDFANGEEIVCKITKKSISQKVPKFKLDKVMDDSKSEQIVNKTQSDEVAQQFLELLRNQQKNLKIQDSEMKQEDNDDGDTMINELNTLKELEKLKDMNIAEGDGSQYSDLDQDDDDDEEVLKILQDMKDDQQDDEEQDDEEQDDEEQDDEEQDDEQQDDEDQDDDDQQSQIEEESDSEQSNSQKELKRKSKKKLKERIAEEKKIRQIETLQASQGPKSSESFEKLLIKQPQRALNWIQYAAFGLENSKSNGLQAARTIFERGVKKINFTNEQEKLYLWSGYLNLEHYYGDIQTFNKVLKRALEINDHLQKSYELWDLYLGWAFRIELFRRRSKKEENLEDLYEIGDTTQVEKLSAIEFSSEQLDKLSSLNIQKVLGIEQILKNSIQSLTKPEHTNLITKCARLQYKSQYKENGRTLFEGLLKNSPKRLDIWAIYFDCEIKFSSKNQVRQLFEKCIRLRSLPIQKVKFFFKRYLDFEMKNGEDEERIEEIKEKAKEYIQSVQQKVEEE